MVEKGRLTKGEQKQMVEVRRCRLTYETQVEAAWN